MAREKILVVDDEQHILELISYNLTSLGYKVIKANNGIDALKLAHEEKPNLILLDIMLPEKDGYDVCREIRGNIDIRNIPIIMLTAKGEELDKVLGLELGADDYVTKPFSVRELMARVKAIMRRTSVTENNNMMMKIGQLSVNFETREVVLNGERIELTYKEYELLEMLIKNKGKILTRETLLDKIWGYEYIGETRTVDVHVRYLRKKIEENDKCPKFIETIRGVGYRFNPNN